MKKYKIRKDIKREPTKREIDCITLYGQDINNKCLDCGEPLYYFIQCDDCYSKMINETRATTD